MAANWHQFQDPELETFLSALNVPPEPTTSPPLLASFWNASSQPMPALTNVWDRNEPISAGMTTLIASQARAQKSDAESLQRRIGSCAPSSFPTNMSSTSSSTAPPNASGIPTPRVGSSSLHRPTPSRTASISAYNPSFPPSTRPASPVSPSYTLSSSSTTSPTPSTTLPQHLASVTQMASTLLDFVSPSAMQLPREPVPINQEPYTLDSLRSSYGYTHPGNSNGDKKTGTGVSTGPGGPHMAATQPSTAPVFLTATGDEETAHSKNDDFNSTKVSYTTYSLTESSPLPLPLPLLSTPTAASSLPPAILALLASHRDAAHTALRTMSSPSTLTTATAALHTLSLSLLAHALALKDPPPCPPLPLPPSIPTTQLQRTLVDQAVKRGLRAPTLVSKILSSAPVKLIVADMFWMLLATLFPQHEKEGEGKRGTEEDANTKSSPNTNINAEATVSSTAAAATVTPESGQRKKSIQETEPSTGTTSTDAVADVGGSTRGSTTNTLTTATSSAAVTGVLRTLQSDPRTPSSAYTNGQANSNNTTANSPLSGGDITRVTAEGTLTTSSRPPHPHPSVLALSSLATVTSLPLPPPLHPLFASTAPRMASSFALLFLSLSPHARDAIIPVLADTVAHYTYLSLAFAFPVAIPHLTTLAARTAISNAFSTLFTGVPSLFPPSAWLIPQVAQSHVATIAIAKPDITTTTHYATTLRAKLSDPSSLHSSQQSYAILNGLRTLVDESHPFHVKKESYLVTDAALEALLGAHTCKVFAQEEDVRVDLERYVNSVFTSNANGSGNAAAGAGTGIGVGTSGKGSSSSEQDATEVIVNAPAHVHPAKHQWVPRSRFMGHSGLIWLFLALHARDALAHMSYGKYQRRNQSSLIHKPENPEAEQNSEKTASLSRHTTSTSALTVPVRRTRTTAITAPPAPPPLLPPRIRLAERDPQLRVAAHKAVVRDIADQLHVLRSETKRSQVEHYNAVLSAGREAADNARALGDLVRKLGAARRAAKSNATASTQAIVRAQGARSAVPEDDLTNGNVGAVIGDGEKVHAVKWGSNSEDGNTRVRKAGNGIILNSRFSGNVGASTLGTSGPGNSGNAQSSGNNADIPNTAVSMGVINSMGISIPGTGYLPPAMRNGARARARDDEDGATGVIIRRIGTKAAEYSDVLHRYEAKKKVM